jgi:diguanylate cyclase (GGDEF)-like protein
MNDHVTGLAPRGQLESVLAALCPPAGGPTPAGQDRTVMAVAILDVIGLKAVNERDGFLAGDAVLLAAADRLRHAAAAASLLARLGGDELVAVFQGPEAGEQAALTTRLLVERSAPPPLRAASVVASADDTPATLIERLYATLRRC